MGKLSILVAVFAVLAILLFTFHWMFRMMHWPGSPYLKVGAFVMGGIGAALWAIDYFIQRSQASEKPDADWDGDEPES